MSDQDNNLLSSVAADDLVDESRPSDEWLSARHTTAEAQETAKWAEGRTQDIAASRILKQELGHDYEGYRQQLDAMSSDERLSLIDKSAEEIAAHLNERTAAEREQKGREETLEKQAIDQAEANFRETSELRQVRHAMKTAYQEATSLDKRIAELQRLNELRDDPTASGWDNLPADKWRAAREGKLESNASEISALIQEKQAKLQEAAIHQSAYHEGARTIQGPSGPSRNMPIGQIVGNDGQAMPITRADIAALVQLERDEQAHQQRTLEARTHYPEWERVARGAVAAGLDVGDREAAFIRSLPNSADVVFYLCSHPNETMSLARMSNHEATRALINISHKAARPSAPAARRTTNAPRPPSPVSGSSRGDFDVNDESISADDWRRNRYADLKRRGKY